MINSLQILGDAHVGHMNGWGGGWMWLWGALMMVIVAVAIVWLVRATASGSRGSASSSSDHARSILAERYARGELTTEEYRERLDHLV
jgi:putative membrane protein